MIRHIVAWNHKPGKTPEQQAADAEAIRQALEALNGRIDGLVELRVFTPLPSSGRDLLLESLLADADALENYQVHPEHIQAATVVRSRMQDRVCLDYEV